MGSGIGGAWAFCLVGGGGIIPWSTDISGATGLDIATSSAFLSGAGVGTLAFTTSFTLSSVFFDITSSSNVTDDFGTSDGSSVLVSILSSDFKEGVGVLGVSVGDASGVLNSGVFSPGVGEVGLELGFVSLGVVDVPLSGEVGLLSIFSGEDGLLKVFSGVGVLVSLSDSLSGVSRGLEVTETGVPCLLPELGDVISGVDDFSGFKVPSGEVGKLEAGVVGLLVIGFMGSKISGDCDLLLGSKVLSGETTGVFDVGDMIDGDFCGLGDILESGGFPSWDRNENDGEIVRALPCPPTPSVRTPE